MDPTQIFLLSAADAARLIREGALSSEQLTRACLDRVAAIDDEVQAWAFLDPAHALVQARTLDALRATGRPTGVLHGVPVGIKDIFDTADMPTANGTVLHAGRVPGADAAVVRRLREAGAVILGKTVTTELACYTPGRTRNPHDPAHTPGGSSSGSAAAVACAMVPVAIGSQTNGSVVRPAAYCGVYGFKPSHGLISRAGVLALSRALDHVGVFARTVDDLALTCEVLAGHDEDDPDTRPLAHIPFTQIAAEPPPLDPTLAFVRTPMWDLAEPEMRDALGELVECLGARVVELMLPETAREVLVLHRIVMEAEMAVSLAHEFEQGGERLSAGLRAQLARGRAHTAIEYQRALRHMDRVAAGLDELFDRYDALITPAAPGQAPRGLESTGNPVFCTLWTYAGMPALSMPLMRAANGLPLGVQLVGRRGDDARLLRTARWLAGAVANQ